MHKIQEIYRSIAVFSKKDFFNIFFLIIFLILFWKFLVFINFDMETPTVSLIEKSRFTLGDNVTYYLIYIVLMALTLILMHMQKQKNSKNIPQKENLLKESSKVRVFMIALILITLLFSFANIVFKII